MQFKKLNSNAQQLADIKVGLQAAQEAITALQQAVAALPTQSGGVTTAQLDAAKTGNNAAVKAVQPATGVLVLTDVANKFNALLAALQSIK